MPTITVTAAPAWGAGYAQSAFEAIVSVSPVSPTGVDAYLARTRTARATPVITPPLTPPPVGPPPAPAPGPYTPPVPYEPQVALTQIWRVSETYPQPVLGGGMPFNDGNGTPWSPSSVLTAVWATQLQVVIGGFDVTFFRGKPTTVQSWSSQEPFGDGSATFLFPSITSFDAIRQPVALPAGPVVGMAATYTGNGYWCVSNAGVITPFGDASFFGDPLGRVHRPISGIGAHPSEYGYALCGVDGGVFCFGDVSFEGSLPSISVTPVAAVVGIAVTPSGAGYWLVDESGAVYAFGDAAYFGNASVGWPTNRATGIARSGGGAGYVIVASNGGVFAFGDAGYHGNGEPYYVADYVGISTWPGDDGYILVNGLGDAYAFGTATYDGGLNGMALNAPVVGVAVGVPAAGYGYWMVAADGGIFTFGHDVFYGSIPSGGTTDFGSLAWLTLGAPVTLNYIDQVGVVHVLWEGVVADWEDTIQEGQIGLQLQCTGCLFQLDWYVAKPIVNPPFVGYSPYTGAPIFGWDIGDAIATAINGTFLAPSIGTAFGSQPIPPTGPGPAPSIGFLGNLCNPVQTGIITVVMPAWDKLLSSYIQNVLAQGGTLGGPQWTVHLQRPRTPVITLKDFETIDWTVSVGGHGIAHDLSQDISSAANVIYGTGTAPPVISVIGVAAGSQPGFTGKVASWANAQYPRTYVGTPPAFPLGTGNYYSPGDGQTGLQPLTNWLRQSGWPLASQDTYTLSNAGAGVVDDTQVARLQQAFGQEQTSLIDEAFWNAAFSNGQNSGAITNVWYAPLWQDERVDPYTYTPSGSIVGQNPFFNPLMPRIENFEQMGSMVGKAQGLLSASLEGQRVEVPAWNGHITLTGDPQEGSRFEILAGQNILLRYFHGRDTLFHISSVDVDFSQLSVDLTVSSTPTDMMTLASIYARDKQAFGPARNARPNLVNINIASTTITFDSESSAGVIPPTPCVPGVWNVIKVPATESGSIAEVNVTATPAVQFAMGVFSGPITPAQLLATFTDLGPLFPAPTGNNPWNQYALFGADGTAASGLDALGLLYGAGGPGFGSACGFYPSDPNGIPVLSGRYFDGSSWPYNSAPGYSPWLWVAFWIDPITGSDATISGVMLPASQGTS